MNLWCEIKLSPGCPRDVVSKHQHNNIKAAHYSRVELQQAAAFKMFVSVLLHNSSCPQAVVSLKGVSNQHCSKKSHINSSSNILYVLPGVCIYWGGKKTEKKIKKIKWNDKIWECKNKGIFKKSSWNHLKHPRMHVKLKILNWFQYIVVFFKIVFDLFEKDQNLNFQFRF